MDRTSHYLLKNFSALFASLFFTLFFITSIVFFIKIASITSVIKINFLELGMMYVFLLPQILIFTLPITFFIAVSISLYNLSKENETIVLFTLGYSPKKIAIFFSIVSFLLTVLLIINFLILIPLSKQLQKNFLDYKKVEAKFNIKATEFGQKFSDWYVYINTIDKDKNYKNIVMYSPETKSQKEKIITAQNAQINNQNSVLELHLDDGKVFQIEKEKLNQIEFKEMSIKSLSQESISKVSDYISYWKMATKIDKIKFNLIFYSLLALFPFATIFFAISIGILTYRYEKSSIYPKIFLIILFYVGSIPVLIKFLHFYTIGIVFLTSITLSYIFYTKKIKQRY